MEGGVKAAKIIMRTLLDPKPVPVPEEYKNRVWTPEPTVCRAAAVLCHLFYFVSTTKPGQAMPQFAAYFDQNERKPELEPPFQSEADVLAIAIAATAACCKLYGVQCRIKYLLPVFAVTVGKTTSQEDVENIHVEICAFEIMLTQLAVRRALRKRHATAALSSAPYIAEHYLSNVLHILEPPLAELTKETKNEIGEVALHLLRRGYEDPHIALFPAESAVGAVAAAFGCCESQLHYGRVYFAIRELNCVKPIALDIFFRMLSLAQELGFRTSP